MQSLEEAIQRLDFHTLPEPGSFLGMLRPYRGIRTEILVDLESALRTVASSLGDDMVPRSLVSSLWAIVHLGRAWALDPGGMIRRNGLISEADLATLTDFLDRLSYAVMELLDQAPEEAFPEELRLGNGHSRPMTFKTERHPGVVEDPAPASEGFVLNHTMLRIKDPAVSLGFYTRVFGMRVLRKLDFPEMKFTLYFLARLEAGEAPPEDEGERTAWTFSQRGILELTHNWGTEAQADFRYHDGNAQPQGFGHICFSVPDLDAAIRWLDENGLTYVKRPEQGKMRDVAFVKDPDGYWIEIIEPRRLTKLGLS